MWGPRQARSTVTCIACGETVSRADAREYDKHGDRWDRTDKAFEYLCKPCFGDVTHYPRDGLEPLLVELEGETSDREGFLEAYVDVVQGESVD